MNYAQFNQSLTGRNKTSRKLANNTYLVRAEGNIVVRLHDTNIVTYTPDNHIILDSGGWKTATTKDRMNKYSPVFIHQERSIWRVLYNGCTSILYDGMVLFRGRIVKPKTRDKKSERLIRQINVYCAKIAKLDKLPEPDLGDCFVCRFEQTRQGTDHLLSHLDEKYIHGTLIVNALRDAGYTDTAISMFYAYPQTFGTFRDSVVRATRRYFKKYLGIAR